MKFQFDFSADEYATLMVALVFAEAKMKDDDLIQRVAELRSTIIDDFKFVD